MFSGELEEQNWHPFLFHFALSVSPLQNEEGDAWIAKGPPAGFTTLERPLANDITRPPTRPVYFRSSPINYSAGFRSDLITVLTVSAFLYGLFLSLPLDFHLIVPWLRRSILKGEDVDGFLN